MIVILIDEIQNLPPEEFEALIMAVHRTNQKQLPLLVVGAGLPLLVRLSGNVKTYPSVSSNIRISELWTPPRRDAPWSSPPRR